LQEKKRPSYKIRDDSPPTLSKPANKALSASSGVKNSRVRLGDESPSSGVPSQDDDEDGLPFYKEPGGVFKEHHSNEGHSSYPPDDEPQSNHIIQHSDKSSPGVS